MARYSETIENVMVRLGELPGIGARTAERLTFHLLKASNEEALALAEAIRDLKTKIRPCRECFNPTERDVCVICADERRDHGCICVVEQPKDLLALESTGAFHGVYHVLMGAVDPIHNVEPDDLTIDVLLRRVTGGEVREVILATNPTVIGDSTALLITERLRPTGAKITRLARGLPAGGQIEYANTSILSDALNERRNI